MTVTTREVDNLRTKIEDIDRQIRQKQSELERKEGEIAIKEKEKKVIETGIAGLQMQQQQISGQLEKMKIDLEATLRKTEK